MWLIFLIIKWLKQLVLIFSTNVHSLGFFLILSQLGGGSFVIENHWLFLIFLVHAILFIEQGRLSIRKQTKVLWNFKQNKVNTQSFRLTLCQYISLIRILWQLSLLHSSNFLFDEICAFVPDLLWSFFSFFNSVSS